MRPALLTAALAAVVLTAACSPHDDAGARSDLKGAEAQLKAAGHDAAKDFRKLAVDAKVQAHKLAADTRGAAHDVTHHHDDDHNS